MEGYHPASHANTPISKKEIIISGIIDFSERTILNPSIRDGRLLVDIENGNSPDLIINIKNKEAAAVMIP